MEDSQTFRIVIAYDNFAAAVRAKDMAERLAAQLESQWDPWPFDLLAEARLREHAADMASQADMIIIAARNQEQLPDGVKHWIERWLPQKKTGPTALVALLDEDGMPSDKPHAPCAYLQRIAKRGNMDFFCNLGSGWQNEHTETTQYLAKPGPVPAPEAFPEYSARSGVGLND